MAVANTAPKHTHTAQTSKPPSQPRSEIGPQITDKTLKIQSPTHSPQCSKSYSGKVASKLLHCSIEKQETSPCFLRTPVSHSHGPVQAPMLRERMKRRRGKRPGRSDSVKATTSLKTQALLVRELPRGPPQSDTHHHAQFFNSQVCRCRRDSRRHGRQQRRFAAAEATGIGATRLRKRQLPSDPHGTARTQKCHEKYSCGLNR